MKTIIAGSRTITNPITVEDAIRLSKIDITEVVSGGCYGVDAIGEDWARYNNIPIKLFRADWNTHGKAAGPIRNLAMAEYAEALIAVWDGVSRGTKNMIREARKQGLKVYIHNIRHDPELEQVVAKFYDNLQQNQVEPDLNAGTIDLWKLY